MICLDIQIYPEGTHFVVPWFERPVIYDVRAKPNLINSTSGSKDLQMVSDKHIVRGHLQYLIA